jgi:hypothetical protein
MPLSVKPNASSKPATSPGKRCGALARAAPWRVSCAGAVVVFVVVVFVTVWCSWWCGGGVVVLRRGLVAYCQ